MLNPSMSDLMKKIDNRYALVNVASQRAREIANITLDNEEISPEKTIKIALDEIANGTIEVLSTSEV